MSKSSKVESNSKSKSSSSHAILSQPPSNNSKSSSSSSQQPQTASFVVSRPGSGNPSSATNKAGPSADPRMAEWQNFFSESGIPEHAANEYAKIFVKERINWPILRSLDKGYLADMGINCVGDQISILQAAKKYSGEQYTPGQNKNPPMTFGTLRMDEQSPEPTAPSKAGRDSEKMEISSSAIPASKRIGTRNEVSSTTAVRSVIRSAKNPSDTLVTFRAKRPVNEDEDDDQERYVLKKLSTLPPRQVRQPSPEAVTFNVRVGGAQKKDVFSRLTPKGVKSSPNTHLLSVLETRLSRLSTNSTSAAPSTVPKEAKPTLRSDFMEKPTPVYRRLGAGSSTTDYDQPRPPPVVRANSGSSVFSRLGIQEGSSRAANSFRAAGGSSDNLRNRLSIKDRLG